MKLNPNHVIYLGLFCIALGVGGLIATSKKEAIPHQPEFIDISKMTPEERKAFTVNATETLVMSTGTRMDVFDATVTVSAILVQDAAAFQILRIHAMPQEPPAKPDSRYLYNGYTYIRPTKPEEIVIDIWTKDGRKWTAQWVEAKEEEKK